MSWRASVVAPARVSKSARRKARRKARHKRNDDGRPVHSFRTLLADLATVTKNRVAAMTGRAPACLLGAIIAALGEICGPDDP